VHESLPWAEKYRPKSLAEVVGNGTAIAALKKWADSWENSVPEKRAVVLSGKPGVGKTSTALALAADLGWGLIELNASDARNEDAIRRVALAGAVNETFRDDGAFIKSSAGGRKLIVLDEADNVFGREDKGGVPAILEMIRNTRQPVVLIVNDYYGLTRRASSLRSLAQEIKFSGMRAPSVEKVLRSIAAAEHIEVSPEVIKKIASEAGGDLRAAINDLEGVARGRTVVPASAADSIGGRDERQTAFGMVGEILHTLDLASARRALWDLDEEPGFALLWLEENVPLAYTKPEDLEGAFHYISRSDMFLGRTVRRQAFGLWSYASDLMAGGVALAKSDRLHSWQRYQFPTWLLQMGRSKAARRARDQVHGKLGGYFHTSKREVASSIAPFLPRLMESDFDLAVTVAAGAGLDAEDLSDLLKKGVETKEVQAISTEARRRLEEGASLGAAADARRGARRGPISLSEAVEAVQTAEKAKKARGKGAKAAKEPPPKEAEPAKEEKPAEDPRGEETDSGATDPVDKPRHRSLLEF
jgi:replication factor C large subunit